MNFILIKNGNIFYENKLVKKNILIENEFIKEITDKEINENNINKIINAENKIVLPGIIDPHVHFREPGMEYKEDFFSGSCAAAAGGITTILDMPNTNPPTLTFSDLKNKEELAKKSIVNYGFHFGSSDDNLEEIKKVVELSKVASVKVFLNLSTGKMMIKDDKILEKIFSNSKIITVHAEDEMVEKAVELTKKCNNKLYLCHITQKKEIEYLKKNKTDNIFIEVTPHHLFLMSDDDKDSFTKMKPELKSKEDQIELLNSLKEGLVDTIGTDHAPHTIEEKKEFQFPHGVPGCETMLPLLLNAVNEGKILLKDVVRLCCINPAKIFRIKNRGIIKKGNYADLTIVDLELEKEVKNSELLTKCKWSPFAGRKLKGWPVMTIVNGNIVFDGKINNIKAKEVEYDGKI